MVEYDVFLSYKSEDYDDAIWLKKVLEINHISCWMAPSSISGGSNSAQAIPMAIKNCKIFLLLVSNRTQQSIWVSKEINQAVSENKIIMPFMIEDCELHSEFKFYLNDVQRYDAFKSKSGAIKKMVTEMWAILGKALPSDTAVISEKVDETVSTASTVDVYLHKPVFKPPFRNLVFWFLLTYFWCTPAGVLITLIHLIGAPRVNNTELWKRIVKNLCVIGTAAGALIYFYALTHYSHCDEAMWSSIIGLVTKLFEWINP